MPNPELEQENDFLMTRVGVPAKKPERRIEPLIPKILTEEPNPSSPATQPPVERPEPVRVTK